MATSIARKGRYAEATKVLRRALETGDCSESEALDLQARIYAQQGLYLQAEACWQQAKQLGGPSSLYDDAIAQLRRSRLPTVRALRIFMGGTALVFLALLLWQVLVATPTISRQLEDQQASVALLRSALDEASETAEQRDRDVTETIASLGRDSVARDALLAEHVGLLVTARGAAEDRAAVLAGLEAASGELRRAVEAAAAGLASQQGEANAAAEKRLGALQTGVAELSKALGSTEASLLKHTEATQGATEKRLTALQAEVAEVSKALRSTEAALLKRAEMTDAAITHISGGMKRLPSADTIAALDKRVTQLQEQLAGIAAAVEAMRKQMPAENKPSGDTDTTTAPTTQATGVLP
ncbi:MAG: hypothetical protein JJU36_06765 [Phycisphaeraceae bacterium]|nr:hypothetical protein [Phycisphaeraceae bacterium]